eukprot:756611-Hanusia_phi.AAC.6
MEDLFSKLQELTEAGDPDYESIISTADQILAKEAEDEDAIKCKFVALLNLKKFSQALDTVKDKPKVAKGLSFERAYALYRLNQHADALEALEASGTKAGEHVGMALLRAQVLYRLGKYKESSEVYASIEDEETDPGELAVNRSAALCSAGDPSLGEQVLRGAATMLGDNADMSYNRACALIEKGDMSGALKALDDAESLYRKECQEQAVGDEELEDGLIVYNVQRGYVMQRMGQGEGAQGVYEEALKKKPTDQEVAAVASNNLFALRGKDTSLFDSAKKAKALNLDEQVEDKLTVQQRRVFALNRCLLNLYTNKTKECHQALSKLEKELEGSELPSLVRAALLAREKKMEECTALLQKHAEANPKTALLVKLTLAQLQLSQGDREGAIAALESVEGAYKQGGIVGSLVKLYEGVKDTTGGEADL